MARKMIAVVGATGAQGGGLARAILADGEFAARAITRNPASDAARKLAEAGAEVVAADLDDVDSLKRAFRGAHGAFCVTNFWEHFSPDKEMAQARSMADAAKAERVAHVIWSTLEDTRKLAPLDDPRIPTLHGKYKVPHFDGKGEADRFFRESGVPTTYLYASFYWENLIYFGAGPKRFPDGKLYFTLCTGDAKMAGVAAEDIGRVAYGIFKAGDRYVGQKVGVAGEHLTGSEMAAAMTRALGEEVRYNSLTPDAYRALGFPGADELGNMFQFYRDCAGPLNALRDVARSRELDPQLQTFGEWLAVNGKKIPVA